MEYSEADEVAFNIPLVPGERLTEAQAQEKVRTWFGTPEEQGWQVFHNVVEALLQRANP